MDEDCNDENAAVYPGATDDPSDGIDADCDGVDECDIDGDGQYHPDCGGPDCDDTDASIYAGAEEIPYDGIDQDCSGEDECDVDDDGFIAVECGGDDCIDDLNCAYPGAHDIPDDGEDWDCDGEDAKRYAAGGCSMSVVGQTPVNGTLWMVLIGLTLLRRTQRVST